MPRLPASLLLRAYHLNPLLPPLLRECRDIPSSLLELRWLREHAILQAQKLQSQHQRLQAEREQNQGQGQTRRGRNHNTYRPPRTRTRPTPSPSLLFPGWRTLLLSYVHRRSGSEPLQYILGNAPFGDLEIQCRKGVLIPRGDTEGWVGLLGDAVGRRVRDDWKRGEAERVVRVLDLCTGSGCIALLLYSLLLRALSSKGKRVSVTGIDISSTALSLSRDNLAHNIALGHLPPSAKQNIRFRKGDVFNLDDRLLSEKGCEEEEVGEVGKGEGKMTKQVIDILTANPPYISPRGFWKGTARSVRNFEPKRALVPMGADGSGDGFYGVIADRAMEWDVGVLVVEVGDTEQAGRVLEILREGMGHGDERVEVWFDDGMVKTVEEGKRWKASDHAGLVSARAVAVWRRDWATWRKQNR